VAVPVTPDDLPVTGKENQFGAHAHGKKKKGEVLLSLEGVEARLAPYKEGGGLTRKRDVRCYRGSEQAVATKYELAVTARDSRSCGNPRESARTGDVPFGDASAMACIERGYLGSAGLRNKREKGAQDQ
jgi:hypothetical protein